MLKTHRIKNVMLAETFLIDELVSKIELDCGFCVWPRTSVYVVSGARGYCTMLDRQNNSQITIPAFALRKSADYTRYYICHELAHAADRCLHNHGPEFMRWFKLICPINLWHHEVSYKPRNAKSAGIDSSEIANKLAAGKITADDL